MESKSKLASDLLKPKRLQPEIRFHRKKVWDPVLRLELVRLSLLDLLNKTVREMMSRHHYAQNGPNHSTFPDIWTGLNDGSTEEKCSICL